MAMVSLTIIDTKDGGLDISFKGSDLKTISTIKKNTAAQNAAISLYLWMRENGMGEDAPDLTEDKAFEDWIQKRAAVKTLPS